MPSAIESIKNNEEISDDEIIENESDYSDDEDF